MRFAEGDFVTDGERQGLIIMQGFVSWVGGGTSPTTLEGLRRSDIDQFGAALGLAPDSPSPTPEETNAKGFV